jgi:hypothetical protein
MSDIFQAMGEKWPSAVVARQEVGRFSGGAVSPKHLANLDCQGEGPKGRFRLGRSVVYPVECLVDWLRRRAEAVR